MPISKGLAVELEDIHIVRSCAAMKKNLQAKMEFLKYSRTLTMYLCNLLKNKEKILEISFPSLIHSSLSQYLVIFSSCRMSPSEVFIPLFTSLVVFLDSRVFEIVDFVCAADSVKTPEPYGMKHQLPIA